jgi:hypothetical protein
MKRLLLTAIVSLLEFVGSHSADAQNTDVTAVISRLQDPITTDDAMKEIEAFDADVKKAISDRLPALMQKEDNYVIRNNESKLAGDLKVVACVPILYRLYVKGDALPTGVTSTIRWRLMDDPAGHALVQIVDTAIPYMKELLKSSDRKANRKGAALFNGPPSRRE